MRNALLLAVSASLFAGYTAEAAFIVPRNGVTWDATYEGDVAPPTGSTPAWVVSDTQGVRANQSSDGDLYTINTTGISAAVSYSVTSNWATAGLVRTAEIRTRVIPESYEAGDGAAGIVLGINNIAFNLRFHSGFVTYNSGGLTTAATLDTTQFHTYRMIVDLAGSPNFTLYIDGNPTPAYTSNGSWFTSPGFNEIIWGDFSTGGLSGHTETDYISWSAGAHPPEVPEPASLALFALGGLALRRNALSLLSATECQMTRPLRILHTAAHPADSFDMVGGTLAHHIDRGDEVLVVSFSHGVRSHALTSIQDLTHGRKSEIDVDVVIDEKEEEVKKGCRILGINNVRFLRLDDDLLLVKEEHVRAVAKIIREFRPHVMITHSPFEMAGISVAHRACCEISILARSMAHGIMKGETSPPHTIAEVFFMWQHGETTMLDHAVPRFPEIIIDVTDVMEKKIKAMDCLKSQFYPGPLARKLFESAAATQTLHLCVPYGETFMRYYPQVENYLPVCEHNLRLAYDPRDEIYARLGRMITTEVPFTPDAK